MDSRRHVIRRGSQHHGFTHQDPEDEPIPIVGGTQTTYTYRNDTSEVVIVFKNDLVKEKKGTFGK